MKIVLHQPEIPQNTGTIGRTCVATGASLHLIEPLGFRLTDREVKRSGMDYWKYVDLHRHMNYSAFLEYYEQDRKLHPEAIIWFCTTKAERSYSDVSFGPEDYLMFGKESAGIPEEILVENRAQCIRIPMVAEIACAEVRSLNLANSVAIVLYEALRQNDFPGMKAEGELHHLKWKDGE